MPEPLTDLERRVLEYLVQYLRSNTYQPSIREIGREFALKSTKTVSELLQSLADKGWIERDPSRSRGVRLLGLQLQPDAVSVPLYAEPEHSPVGGLILDRQLGRTGTYLLGMPDALLAGIGILRGDLLFVEPVKAAELGHGDIVCARLGTTLVVRRLTKIPDGAVLEGAGAAAPIPLAGVAVHGRVTGLIRRLQPVAAASQAVPVGVPV
jgi:repressor LexA